MAYSCCRCSVTLDLTGIITCDYITAPDLIVEEEREGETVEIQKTGLVCPTCYNAGTDTVIWGTHKT